MSHLQETGFNYFRHLYRAWSIAFVLVIHGLFPNVWQHKASNMMEADHEQDLIDHNPFPRFPFD